MWRIVCFMFSGFGAGFTSSATPRERLKAGANFDSVLKEAQRTDS